MNLRKTARLAAPALLMLGTPSAFGHPGDLDRNGGHYFGASYHCHMAGCEMPDTFTPGRARRDGLLTDYRGREKFFNEADWTFEIDLDRDCQNTRQEMLVLTSRSEVKYTNPRNCVVRTGEWLDEYTGETFTVAAQLEVSHIIPPLYAHTHGGDRWMPQKKLMFANDPLNIVMVERREARRKRDRGPDRWMPREGYQCEYARLWQTIAEKYDLQLGASDRAEIGRVLRDCPEMDEFGQVQ